MTCRDAIEVLGDYLEATLDETLAARLDEHLAECPPCRAYLDTYRRTREVASRVSAVDMPAEMRARLREFLLEHLRDPST
jgi:anti-sigma factor (TIGR02949 family)